MFPYTLSQTNFTLNQSNHIVVQLENDNNVRVYINGQLDSSYTTTAGTNTYFASSKTVTIASSAMSNVALYTQPMSASRIAAHFNAGQTAFTGELTSTRLNRVLDNVNWPIAWRDIETGVQNVNAYLPDGNFASRYWQQIANAEQGEVFINRDGHVQMLSRTTTGTVNIKGFFDDNGTDAPFSDIDVDANSIDTIRNNIIVTYTGGQATATDSTSVAAYGESTETLDARLIDNGTDATVIGDTRLARAKDPRTRITMLGVNVRSDVATTVPTVAPLDLGDDVAVSFTPTGVGDPLWRAVTVQGIRHTITGNSWETQLYLSPSAVNTNGALLVLDDDTYGKLDDGNKLG